LPKILANFDVSSFWKKSAYARKEYVEKPFTAAMVRAVERELGFKLPASYLELMRSQNGGIPRNTCFPTKQSTSWAEDHVAISGIFGVGGTKTYSLCGMLGSRFMQDEWGYPKFGICICDCPSAGHDMIMLDYRRCGKQGEPRVIHVDQEFDFKITLLAKNFETFVRGLVNESVYDTSAEDLKRQLEIVDQGEFSSVLRDLLARSKQPELGDVIRKLCRRKTTEFGLFALHDDEVSQLVYDLQFYLFTKSRRVTDQEQYEKAYPSMIALSDGAFTIGGYGPGFVSDWFKDRRKRRAIVTDPKRGLCFSKKYEKELLERAQQFR
jgi:hypothetical protein